MKLGKSFWEISTFLVVVFFLFKPEFMMLGLFIDGIGLELFLLLLEVKFVAISLQYIKPILQAIYRQVSKLDRYFFIPTKSVTRQLPAMVIHAVPGLMAIYFIAFVNKFNVTGDFS